MSLQHNRFKDAPWYPKEDLHILIGGAGGIGSWTAFLLARVGFKIVVYDFDLLEEHNLGGQLYPKRLIGKSKVESLESVIKDYSDENIITFNEKIDKNSPSNPVIISAFDNMQAREDMFTSWKATYSDDPTAIFIDGRLEAEQMWIYCVRGTDKEAIKKYTELLETSKDEDIKEAPCTLKQTSHAAAMIASHITGFFTNHITNVVEGGSLRTVPYEWEYFIPMDLLTQ